MKKNLIAKVSITVEAPVSRVWDALVKPEAIKEYMFGAEVASDWYEGGSITWKGEWKGKEYEDKGDIRQIEPERLLQYTHYSPLSGLPDKPENYHLVTIELTEKGSQTLVTLSQDNNSTDEAREHSEKNWGMMLEGLKTFVEERNG